MQGFSEKDVVWTVSLQFEMEAKPETIAHFLANYEPVHLVSRDPKICERREPWESSDMHPMYDRMFTLPRQLSKEEAQALLVDISCTYQDDIKIASSTFIISWSFLTLQRSSRHYMTCSECLSARNW